MPIVENTTYVVVCDATNCFNNTDDEESESFAKEVALDEGWTFNEDTEAWNCPKCAKAKADILLALRTGGSESPVLKKSKKRTGLWARERGSKKKR